MSDEETTPLLPLATKTLRLMPGDIVPAVEGSPYVVHFTMAALDWSNPVNDKKTASTLRILRVPEEESDEDMDEDDDEQSDEDTEPVVMLTLSPNTQFQQTIDLYVAPTEGVCFQVLGSYPIHLTGNLVDHPISAELMEELEGYEDEEEEDGSEEDSDEEDIPDAVEALDSDGSEEDSEEEDSQSEGEDSQSEGEEEDAEKDAEESSSEDELDNLPKKRQNESQPSSDKKKVKFSAALEQGPTPTKFPTTKLEGNVIIEERKVGQGPSAKKGSRVSMRYVGKLANGKPFDKNTTGKPFSFSLGRGEVIKGWDIGIVGMKAGGERRIIIPAPMAYGKQSLPGIPKNSELRFDVKCLSIK